MQAPEVPKKSIFKTTRLEGSSETPTGPSNSSIDSSNSVSASTESDSVAPLSTHFDVAKNISIVPPYRAKEVEAYFRAFE